MKQDEILTEKYKATTKEIRSDIAHFLEIKEKSTLAIALSLATDEKIRSFILKKKIPQGYYADLIHQYKANTLYQNIWIQIIDRDGISLYRSWTKAKGDDLSGSRAEISKMEKQHKASVAISVGSYDMSIKAMVPLFDHERFIGFIEIISHFNSIAKTFEKEEIDSVVLADKKYAKHLTHPFTKMFVDGYYIANLDAKKSLVKLLSDNKIETFFNKEYRIVDGYLIVAYPLKDTNEKTIGHYLAFKKLSNIESKDLQFFQFRWIVFTLLFFMAIAGVVNIVMYYNMRKQKKYYKNIIDSSSNMIIINNKKNIIDTNKVFFKYFSKYKSLDEFRDENTCVCNFFVDEEGYLSKGTVAYNWLEKVIDHPDEHYKVKMIIEEKIYYFLVNAAVIDREQNHYSVIFADITKEERYKEELEDITIRDSLTGLYNRRFYETQIDEEIYNAKRYEHALSVIMLDIDFFKKVNDEHGHSVGDEVLIYYANLVKESLREADKVCRVGGEEFVIILPYTTKDDAVKIAEKLRVLVEKSKKILPITMSFGVTEYIKGESEDFLYKRADEALYEAKNSGRNRVVVR
ncbi:sensor domain-containing diguanylate cyclase [Sulfurimonas paralvinellae]|uniref:sensor domain-containing diguanylate cyclase n=1 Tax=Sulfurimonas paralvinellae TaxID=317658 RepID=UPI0018660020|nr:diguanylate cyclase [Sulfurimonas paralvinellae]